MRITRGGLLKSSDAAGAFVPLAASSTAPGLHRNTPSSTYGEWFTFGNAPDSNGGAFTGTPAEGWGALVVYHKFGDYTGFTNAPIYHTTQAAYVIAQYWGPTIDDSAEALSANVLLKDTGTGFTQSRKVTAFEADTQIEGANQVTGANSYVLGMGSRIIMNDTSNADTGYGAKVSAATKNNRINGSTGTLSQWQGYRDDAYNPAGTIASASESFHGLNRVTSEQSFLLGRSGFGGSVTADLAGAQGALGTNLGILTIQQPSPANTTTIADGGITSGSRLVTTATAPTAAWIGRILTNANLPVGTQVVNYYGTGPYTLVVSAAATGTASSQTITITEPDLVGLKIIQGTSGLQRAIEVWQQGVTGAPVLSVSRTGAVGAQSGFQVWNSSGTAISSWTSTALTLNDATTVVLGSTTGTKLGTATTQKLGFWNATPVVQQARPTDAASIITLLTTLGLCA